MGGGSRRLERTPDVPAFNEIYESIRRGEDVGVPELVDRFIRSLELGDGDNVSRANNLSRVLVLELSKAKNPSYTGVPSSRVRQLNTEQRAKYKMVLMCLAKMIPGRNIESTNRLIASVRGGLSGAQQAELDAYMAKPVRILNLLNERNVFDLKSLKTLH